MEDFTVTDAWAVHPAARNAEHEAQERREMMPSSAEALQRHADLLEIVKDKIVQRLPPEHRAPYLRRK
jgi:hypothetical protein